MADQQDRLSNEITVSAKLEETGISASVKSRAISAIDRLAGNIFDLPNAWLERRPATLRAETAVEVALINEKGKAAIAAAYTDPEFGMRVAEKFLEDQGRKQINREAVAAKAVEHIEDAGEIDDSDTPIDDDWLGIFEGHSEKASSDRLRDLWGSVLAGEIRKPGAFSFSTLRFLSEVDKEIAEIFENETRVRIADGFILKPSADEMIGKKLLDLTFLEEVGLLQDVNGDLGRKFRKDAKGEATWREGSLLLVMKTEHEFRVPIIRITRTGRDILKILPPRDPMIVLEAMASSVDTQIVDARIAHIIGEDSGTIKYRTIKLIKTSDPSDAES